MEYSEIELKEGKIVLSKGIENFKAIFNEKGSHLYLTSYSYDMPTDYYDLLLENIEFINDIKVIFNIFNFGSDDDKIDLLIKRVLNKNPYTQLFYNKYNHSKIISNGKILYIGSANVTNYTKNNFEAGVIISNKETIEKVEREVFDYAYLKYEPIFTDPIAPIIVPFYFILSEVNKEFNYIENLLKNVDTFQYMDEADLPDYGWNIEEYLNQYVQMFKMAKVDLSTFIDNKSEESFIVINLLNEIENTLNIILSTEPIGSNTRYFFDFIEDYRNVLEIYKKHYWRLNTFENEVVIYKEKIYMKRMEAVLKMLLNLRVKWISLIKSKKYIKYKNTTIPIIQWLEHPILAKKYWQYFLQDQ
ncbi:hypothetical protein ETC04_17175 [Geobacillus sp. MR]|uniref:hypothetical protein n=1 Tax=Geobacillus sp. MR TaxID=2508875 RepID=UPI00148CC732|nr:hypothetical protein [Geobacillus sp. MR]NNU88796.1 hypothetical protein [Geobacillus sp. MR]